MVIKPEVVDSREEAPKGSVIKPEPTFTSIVSGPAKPSQESRRVDKESSIPPDNLPAGEFEFSLPKKFVKGPVLRKGFVLALVLTLFIALPVFGRPFLITASGFVKIVENFAADIG